jgi:hypothetical protein
MHYIQSDFCGSLSTPLCFRGDPAVLGRVSGFEGELDQWYGLVFASCIQACKSQWRTKFRKKEKVGGSLAHSLQKVITVHSLKFVTKSRYKALQCYPLHIPIFCAQSPMSY